MFKEFKHANWIWTPDTNLHIFNYKNEPSLLWSRLSKQTKLNNELFFLSVQLCPLFVSLACVPSG